MAYKALKTKRLQNYRSAKNYPVFLTNNTMKKLSEIYKELGIGFIFPIEIWGVWGNQTYYENSDGYWEKWERDDNGCQTYCENCEGYWRRSKRDAEGNETYCEDSNGFWQKKEYDYNGRLTYFEDSKGVKRGTPKSTDQ